MKKTIEVMGQQFEIEAYKRAGGWSWRYKSETNIADMKDFKQLPSEEAALAEAEQHVRDWWTSVASQAASRQPR